MRGITLILAAFLAVAAASHSKKIVCYYGSWAGYRPGNGKFEVSDIDASLCTHLIYAFVSLGENGTVKVLDDYNDLPEGKDGYAKFNALRDKNPSLTTMVSIGGWNAGSANFSKLVADADLRKKFAENVVAFLKQYGFNGFDVDWEYPAQRDGSSSDDKQNFVLLLKDLKESFAKDGLVLSAAVAAAESSASLSYDIPAIAEHLDFINVMAYDLHGSFDNETGINAPTIGSDKLNDAAIIKYWIEQGAPAEKLILGAPLYGRGFTLADPKNNGIGAAISGPSLAGPYTQENGTLSYLEICEKLVKESDWQTVYNRTQQVPYAIKGNQWVGFDNQRSLGKKGRLVKKHRLGGMMVWSVDNDDFKDVCGGGKFPLLKAINKVLKDCDVPSATESAFRQDFILNFKPNQGASGWNDHPRRTSKRPQVLE